MWINREIVQVLTSDQAHLVQILLGPRQCGKSSLWSHLGKDRYEEMTFDDFQLRNLANQDPGLFLSLHNPPLILDEVQYVPELFPEIKKIVDQIKKKKMLEPEMDFGGYEILYRLTGSNNILLEKNVGETLVGRAAYYYLNTLSVSEILRAFPEKPLGEMIFMGGWPELYTNPHLKTVPYLNDYISNYLEKDIAQSAGIQKLREYYLVLGLLAARAGQLLNYSDIAKDSGVKGVTIKEWVGILEKSFLLYTLAPYESNLNKRLIKTPKIYFWDTGLAVRLQGWGEEGPMLRSPQIGHLYENLVLAEILKFRQNHQKNWTLHFWRTKEGEEIDFILRVNHDRHVALDAKWGTNLSPQPLSKEIKREFPSLKELILVSPETFPKERKLSAECRQISLGALHEFLSGLP